MFQKNDVAEKTAVKRQYGKPKSTQRINFVVMLSRRMRGIRYNMVNNGDIFHTSKSASRENG
jgi:hypothetical protein